MNKKILIPIIAFGIILIIFVLTSLFLGWPYKTIPSFEGRVVDKTTGEPVKDAIIQFRYVKAVPSGAGGIGETAKEVIVSTDENGYYFIPEMRYFHLLSGYHSLYLKINHPLYETKEFIWFKEEYEALKEGKEKYKPFGERSFKEVKGAYKEGRVKFDISLLSLKDKFSEDRVEDNQYVARLKSDIINEGIHDLLGFEFNTEGPFYFKNALKLGLKINPQEIFKKWDEIAEPFINRSTFKHSLESGKSKILNI